MRVETKTQDKFEPVTFCITAESENDLRELYHRFNIASSTILEHFQNRECCWKGESDSYHIWSEADKIMKRRNIKP